MHITGQNGYKWIDVGSFKSKGIDVGYQKLSPTPYRQFSRRPYFVSNLSAIDLLFNCGPEAQNIIGHGSTIIE